MTVEILEKPNELDDIADQWRALHPPLHAPYLTYDWFRACAEATSPPARLAIVVLRSGDDIRAIAPLVLQRRRSTRLPFLEILGNPLCELFEPTDFFYADTDSLKELLYAIMAMGHPLRLERIPNISPTAAAARDIPGVWRLWDWRKTYAPVLPLSTDLNDLSAIWPKHRKRSVKRAWKKAERFGDVSFELVTPEPSTIARHFQEFLAVEDASWKGRAGSALAKTYMRNGSGNRTLKRSRVLVSREYRRFASTVGPSRFNWAPSTTGGIGGLKSGTTRASTKCLPACFSPTIPCVTPSTGDWKPMNSWAWPPPGNYVGQQRRTNTARFACIRDRCQAGRATSRTVAGSPPKFSEPPHRMPSVSDGDTYGVSSARSIQILFPVKVVMVKKYNIPNITR